MTDIKKVLSNVEQNLSTEEKKRARDNIGAISEGDLSGLQSTLRSLGIFVGNLDNYKQDKLTPGTNITIDEDNVISSTGGSASVTPISMDLSTITWTREDSRGTIKSFDHTVSVPAHKTLDLSLQGIIQSAGNNDHYAYWVYFIIREINTSTTLQQIVQAAPRLPNVESSLTENLGVTEGSFNVRFILTNDSDEEKTYTLAAYNETAPLGSLLLRYTKANGVIL